MNLGANANDRIEIDGLVLFGTPHFRAGLAQWALISAKKLRISCADKPGQQNWSKLKGDLIQIADMQKKFQDLDPGPKLACYLGLRTTEHKLVSNPFIWVFKPEY